MTAKPMNAGRAPVASSSSKSIPHLAFQVAGEPYACPIHFIQRLLRAADARLLPTRKDAPAWETGRLMNSEGQPEIPVVSLRLLWGFPAIQDSARNRQALLVVELAGQQIALLVDACLGVLTTLPERGWFHLSSALKGTRGIALGYAIPWNKSLLITLDLDEIFCHQSGRKPDSVSSSVERL